MKKLLLSTALATGIGAFALSQPAMADHESLTGGEKLVIGLTGVLALSSDPFEGNEAGVWGDLDSPYNSGEGGTATAYVDKDKDKRVIELVAKLKVAVILVGRIFTGNSAAESDVLVNQDNRENTVNVTPGDGNTERVLRGYNTLHVSLRRSANRNSGTVQLNLDAGNMVNQANVISLAVGGKKVTFADAQAAAEQNNTSNFVFVRELPLEFTLANAQKTVRIVGSINGNSGVVMVNANTGNMNNQLNALSGAVGVNAEFALAESVLGQHNAGNTVDEQGTIKTTRIAGSINGNSGVAAVNASTGNMNNQATVISFSGAANLGGSN